MIREIEKKPRGRKLSNVEMGHMAKPEGVSARAKKHFRHKPYGMGKDKEDDIGQRKQKEI